MAITTKTFLGTLTIEYREDGAIESIVRTDKTLVRDGDALVMAPKLEAVALTREVLASVVGDKYAALAAQVAGLTEQLGLATVELSDARRQAASQAAGLMAQIDQLLAERANLLSNIQEAQSGMKEGS